MDFLTPILARLFEQFKMRSPKLAAAVLLALMLVVYFADQGTLMGLITLPAWAAVAVKWLAIFISAVTSTSTFQFLSPELQAKRGIDPAVLQKLLPAQGRAAKPADNAKQVDESDVSGLLGQFERHKRLKK